MNVHIFIGDGQKVKQRKTIDCFGGSRRIRSRAERSIASVKVNKESGTTTVAIFTNLKMLGLLFILSISSSVSADRLILEKDGVRQIIAQIKAKTDAATTQPGTADTTQFVFQTIEGVQVVNVVLRHAARILINGRSSNIQLHQANVDGHGAMLILSDDAIKITYKSGVGQLTLSHVDLAGKKARISKADPENPANPEGGHGIDVELDTPPKYRPTLIDMRIDAATVGNPPIAIHIFKHNDVMESIEQLLLEHFSWWVQQMNDINKRHIFEGNDPLFSDIVLNFASDGDIQSFDYRGDPEQNLRTLAGKMSQYKATHVPRSSYRRVKFLLVTENAIGGKALGVAYIGGQYAMAADDDDQVIAHELGHLFNGRHEDADVVHNGRWCETILTWLHAAFRASCHYYTDENKDTIADYLKR